jgi:large repetitive protein
VTSNNSQYGQDISVQVKACRKYPEITLCSADWSAAFHLGVPVDNSALGGLSFSHDPFGTILDPPVNGTWTWSSSPAGAYDSISYSCGSDTHTISPGDGGSCATTQTSSVDQDFPQLTITINANGNTYVRTYNWSDYD